MLQKTWFIMNDMFAILSVPSCPVMIFLPLLCWSTCMTFEACNERLGDQQARDPPLCPAKVSIHH